MQKPLNTPPHQHGSRVLQCRAYAFLFGLCALNSAGCMSVRVACSLHCGRYCNTLVFAFEMPYREPLTTALLVCCSVSCGRETNDLHFIVALVASWTETRVSSRGACVEWKGTWGRVRSMVSTVTQKVRCVQNSCERSWGVSVVSLVIWCGCAK